ncbi:uncharacterized protein LOC108474921 [Gossypium arboreum]|uniref:uncharacterized protein LOC108474921 n=1 Tax=Gossypium arboreum TaxID=29729 RepID=UPI0008191870|nr:uncharacterized protein LOC108474921 [Gossypium arboreum]
MFACLSLFNDGRLLAELQVRLTWIDQFKEKQLLDESLAFHFRQVENGETTDFGLNEKGVLCFRERVCILRGSDLRQSILQEAHSSPYAMHPGENRLYQDLRKLYWWPGLKREVSKYVSSWEEYLLLAEFVYNNSYQSNIRMAPFQALYDRRCCTPTCWTELGDRRVLGPELIFDTEDKVKLIRDRLKEASDGQKSYAYLKRKEIEYSVGDYVFPKVSP